MAAMFFLRVEPAVGEPFDHQMEEESLVIGRASESDLVLADRFLSRRHARLTRRDGRLFVEDLGSRNGTVLNEQPVEGPTEVHAGDRIRVSGSAETSRRVVPVGEWQTLGNKSEEWSWSPFQLQ